MCLFIVGNLATDNISNRCKSEVNGPEKKGKRCPVSSLFATMTYREKTSQGRHGKSKDAG